MTERERWTVYPLLFLSLGIAMRSQITSSLKLHEITCDTLKSRNVEIVGEDGGVRLLLTMLPPGLGGGGLVQVISGEGKAELVLQALPHGGLVELGTERGVPQVVLAVAPAGGLVETLDTEGKLARTLGVRVNPLMLGKVGPPPAPPTEKPAGETAEPQAETPPAANEPVNEKPATEKPASEKPDSEKPAGEQPAADKPAGEKPAGTADEPAEKPAQP